MTPGKQTAQLIDAACKKHGTCRKEIFGYCRVKNIIKAQKMIIDALYARGYSNSKIGRIMKRDHSSVWALRTRCNRKKIEKLGD